jgi:dolichol-phosphate mannosyltransferase
MEYGMADFRLIDRQALDSILQFREDGLFLRGLVQWIGYPCSKIKYVSHERIGGASKYTLMKMIKFALSGITSFSIIPLRLGIIIGALTSIISFVLMVEAFHAKVILKTAVPGWATTVIVLTFMFGIKYTGKNYSIPLVKNISR